MVLLTDDDTIDVIEHDHPDAVGFNREFLLEAIELGAPTSSSSPLTVRSRRWRSATLAVQMTSACSCPRASPEPNMHQRKRPPKLQS